METPLDAAADYAASPDHDLSLAFANTRCAGDDLLRWAGGPGGVPATLVDRCRDEAATILPAAIDVRDLCRRIFTAVAGARTPGLAELRALDALLRDAPARVRLLRRDKRFVWHLGQPTASASALLAPVLWSAADLLAGPRVDRVRRCAHPDCHRLFLDDSRAGNRRWCANARLHHALRSGSGDARSA